MSIAFCDKFSIVLGDGCVSVTVNRNFHGLLLARYAADAPPYVPEIRECDCGNCPARLAFAQLRRGIESGITSAAYYESKVVELMFLLGRDEERPTRLAESDRRAVNEARRIISSRLGDCPKISELAVMTGTSASKLQGDFKAEFGITIHEYLWEERMNKALELLQKSDAPIYAIAMQVGCKKAGRFSEMFRKAYGVSPAEFRGRM